MARQEAPDGGGEQQVQQCRFPRTGFLFPVGSGLRVKQILPEQRIREMVVLYPCLVGKQDQVPVMPCGSVAVVVLVCELLQQQLKQLSRELVRGGIPPANRMQSGEYSPLIAGGHLQSAGMINALTAL